MADRSPAATVAADPLVPLGDTGWHVWRSAILRGPGFPADGLDRLRSTDCATAADAHLAGDLDAAGFATAFANGVEAVNGELRAIAADPLFREAVTWQSLTSASALDGLVRSGANASRNSRQREREILISRYWQRYCGKNDTIGFFGPVCWVALDDEEEAAARGGAGPNLVRTRAVEFEWRALTAFADRLAADERYRPWLPVIRQPHLSVSGFDLARLGGPPLKLSRTQAALVNAADGRPAHTVVADAGFRTEADAYLELGQLAERGLLRWRLDLPFNLDAEPALVRWLDTVGDPAARAEARAGLDRLLRRRDEVVAAAEDPVALAAALTALDAEFEEVTGGSAHHRPGATYAGRNLVYEHTVRDLDLVLGAPVLDALAPALEPLLQAARWLTVGIAEAYESALRDLYEEAGRAEVPLGELWYLANGVMFSEGPAAAVLDEFTRRWGTLLGTDGAHAGHIELDPDGLAAAARTVFPADAPGWSAGRLHSPDLHLCAESLDALARGEFTAVLGELHVAWLTCNSQVFVRFHPEPEALHGAVSRDLGPRVVPKHPSDFPRLTARIADALVGPDDELLGYTPAPVSTTDRVLPLTSLMVSDVDGRLVARAPDGRTWPLVELFSPFLSALSVDAYKLVAAAAHTPRVTVGRLVVQRETWRTTVGACAFAAAKTEADRFLGARAWKADLGLPERVFARVGTELKPCYVDFASPAFVAAFVAMVRQAQRAGGPEVPVVISEMLPTPEQAWVPDAAGRRYFSELRVCVRDPQAAGGAG